MNITLKTLPTVTEQQVFDHVAKHLLSQGCRSTKKVLNEEDQTWNNICAYRGDAGLKCAAGCLIDDSEYSPEWERMNWGALADIEVPGDHYRLISRLQNIHDAEAPAYWKLHLTNLAEDFSLSTDILV